MKAFLHLLRRELHPIVALLIASAVLVGLPGWMILDRAAILRNGAEIVLKTAPVDPRDFMRGDYVQLRYEEISGVDGSLFEGELPPRDRPAKLWLTLRTGEDGLGVVKAVSLNKPVDREPGEVFLRSEPLRLSRSASSESVAGELLLSFGIERYYVPEGEGLEIEAARNQQRTTVAVRISDDGDAQIARIMIDGKALYEEPLY
ncbi:uncharacterized membrane-anchored protein [Hoeflea halophila]|uniref:Uncharacterized membrane-anchored protein n=1 Tax=Hoeflea halophila TaxID=714899 RepID=A0A286HKT2_9HYPH|nr:GDYXXLXY domain-containing protein [Hoeflea halophila]SOE08372.1 uncharacterized membrane-anchored protein [Hoeflea halophila]